MLINISLNPPQIINLSLFFSFTFIIQVDKHNTFMSTDLHYKDRPLYTSIAIALQDAAKEAARHDEVHKKKGAHGGAGKGGTNSKGGGGLGGNRGGGGGHRGLSDLDGAASGPEVVPVADRVDLTVKVATAEDGDSGGGQSGATAPKPGPAPVIKATTQSQSQQQNRPKPPQSNSSSSGVKPISSVSSSATKQVPSSASRNPTSSKVPTSASSGTVTVRPTARKNSTTISNGVGASSSGSASKVASVTKDSSSPIPLPKQAPQPSPISPPKQAPQQQQLQQEQQQPARREPLPSLQGDEFVLSMHVRHTDPADTGAEDRRGELSCMLQTLAGFGVIKRNGGDASASASGSSEDYSKVRGCVLLLASDRPATITRLTAAAKGLGCSVRVADHIASGNSNSNSNSNSKGAAGKESALAARGPWRDSLSSVADLELLTHADAFIGSTLGDYVPGNFSSLGVGGIGAAQQKEKEYLSAFSMLIASLVVTNGRQPQSWIGPLPPSMLHTGNGGVPPIPRTPDGWLGIGDTVRVRYLPTCGASYGSYLPIPGHSLREAARRHRQLQGGSNALAAAQQLPPNGYYVPSNCPFFYWQCDRFNASKISSQCTDKKFVSAARF